MSSETPSPSLALIVVDTVRAASSAASAADRSTLERIAALGRVSRLPYALEHSAAALERWEVALLDALGLTEQGGALPSAAIAQSGESLTIVSASESWTYLTCVHFAAGMNDVAAMTLRGPAALTEHERAEIAATLAPHLASYGYELHATGGTWRVRCPRVLDAHTLAPAVAFEGALKDALPRGPDAAELRRLMTEMQMLLHEHPVNRRRARAQQPAANGTWMWSVANLTRERSSATLPVAFGDEPYLKGLYLLHSQTVRAERFDVTTLREAVSDHAATVAIVKPDSRAALDRDWLTPLLEALRAGRLRRLTVYFDRWRLVLDRRGLLRFWRRALPQSQWPA